MYVSQEAGFPLEFPVFSDEAIKVFSKIEPQIIKISTALNNEAEKLSILFNNLAKSTKRLEEAESKSITYKSLGIVTLGISLIAPAIAAGLFPVNLTTRILTAVTPFILGAVADVVTGKIQAEDLCTEYRDPVSRFDSAVPCMLPLLNIIAAVRTFRRVPDLEMHVQALHKEILSIYKKAVENQEALKNYVQQYSEKISTQIALKINKIQDNPLYHNLFIALREDRIQLRSDSNRLKTIQNELKTAATFYKR